MNVAAVVGLGDHPALDFVNTLVSSADGPLELIVDGPGYLRWLAAAGLVADAEPAELAARFPPARLDAIAHAAVELREWLRPLIARWVRGDAAVPEGHALTRLNVLLAADSRFGELVRDGVGLRVVDRQRWASADELLVPPARAAADLFAHGDRALVRPCAGPTCTLWFYDRTRGRQRRWCSMALCGNRAKARAHRARAAGG
ncbi:CGNR zinc finger domain-containing protein [Frankia sp. QA3]|uniref:CGNR zinc finger domain-containing protein n=1 Tax=Frankia sp. QA3 TaxID=710111 RepID=UPI000269C524|nr:CGNR zinc finger domain-containing protein [Frankia sp. QA3]EIV94384.1 Zn-ribbon-like motif-containing protein [Frankia sp. QA3]